MTRVILRNRSYFYSTVNEVKMGERAYGSCDPNLRHLGTFHLQPEEEREVANIQMTTDFYWKNELEYYWTHRVAWDTRDTVYLDASMRQNSNSPVDICDRQRVKSLSEQIFPASTTLDDIKDSFDVGNGVRFYIVGRNRDGYQIRRNGELISYEWLWPYANDPGKLFRDDVVEQLIGNDVNIAFRWGRNNDLMFAIAVRGSNCNSTIGEYWMHPSRNLVSIHWDNENVVRFSHDHKDVFLKYESSRWIKTG